MSSSSSTGQDLIDLAVAQAQETRSVVVRTDAIDDVPRIFAETFPGAVARVVADSVTYEIAGRAVHERLLAAGIDAEEPFVFGGKDQLYAEYESVEKLRTALLDSRAVPVAVGAGTLNDIVKRTSGEQGKLYMSVATAASMDGYSSFGASIAVDGFKQTLSCPAPTAVVADLTIMAAAPPEMTAAGYGDLSGKIPAGGDWILADRLGIEMIDPAVWDLVQGPLREALAHPARLAERDPSAIEGLSQGLIMSGLAMQMAQSSRPASGAEHLFSHTWEMEGHGVDFHPRLSHGFKVALGTVSVCALYDWLLRQDISTLDPDAAARSWPELGSLLERVPGLFSVQGLREASVYETRSKYIDAVHVAERVEQLQAMWPDLRADLSQQMVCAQDAAAALRAAGAPCTPREIGLTTTQLRDTYLRARYIRSRYTVLDTMAELGLLERCVEELFSADGYWGRVLN